MPTNIKRYESRLNVDQIEAARLLSVNRFLPRASKELEGEALQQAKEAGEVRLNMYDIAEQVGISDRQLYNWRTTNDDFIAYTNALASQAFMSHLPDVMEKHLDMTIKGQGSMKGIELFYKFGGLLIDKQEVKTEETSHSDKSLEERLERLRARREGSEEGDK